MWRAHFRGTRPCVVGGRASGPEVLNRYPYPLVHADSALRALARSRAVVAARLFPLFLPVVLRGLGRLRGAASSQASERDKEREWPARSAPGTG